MKKRKERGAPRGEEGREREGGILGEGNSNRERSCRRKEMKEGENKFK
jgi:hypothetical protein